MSIKMLATLTASAVLLLSAENISFAAGEFKVHGSSTVAQGILGPNKAAVEKETGLVLAIVPNGSGNGLKDLAAGTADIAMISAPLASEVAAANKKAAGSLDAASFVESPIGFYATKIIVNSNNPVKTLSAGQVKDILTGKITSWKDVGGADQDILVVTEGPGSGGRTLLEGTLLGDAEITGKARAVQAVAQIDQIVSQVPSAIGYGNQSTISSAVSVIPDIEVRQPLILVTKGVPGDDAKKLISVAAKFGAPK
jgi:phosphate transport system substrate-binding protein